MLGLVQTVFSSVRLTKALYAKSGSRLSFNLVACNIPVPHGFPLWKNPVSRKHLEKTLPVPAAVFHPFCSFSLSGKPPAHPFFSSAVTRIPFHAIRKNAYRLHKFWILAFRPFSGIPFANRSYSFHLTNLKLRIFFQQIFDRLFIFRRIKRLGVGNMVRASRPQHGSRLSNDTPLDLQKIPAHALPML